MEELIAWFKKVTPKCEDIHINNYIKELALQVSDEDSFESIIKREVQRMKDVFFEEQRQSILKLQKYNGKYYMYLNRDDEVYFLKFDMNESNVTYKSYYGRYVYTAVDALYYEESGIIDRVDVGILYEGDLKEISKEYYEEIEKLFNDYHKAKTSISNKLEMYVN